MRLQLLAHSFTKGAEGSQGDVIEVTDEKVIAYLIDNGAARELKPEEAAPEILTPAAASGNGSSKSDSGGKAKK